MDFRIEKKDSFKIAGMKCGDDFKYWEDFNKNHIPPVAEKNYFKAPFWLLGAYFLEGTRKDSERVLIGFELRDESMPEGRDYGIETVPATTWAVFQAPEELNPNACGKTYAKVVSEWLPLSNYVRNEAAPFIEVYMTPDGHLEVWVPVLNK